MSDESKELNRQAHLGKKHSNDTKKQMSANRKGKYIGKDSPCWGKPASDETRKKMSDAHKSFYADDTNRKCHSERMKAWWTNRKKENE